MKLAKQLEQFRLRVGPYGTDSGSPFGMFLVPGPHGRDLKIIASNGSSELGINWEHVSVSLQNRCPNWPEMCFVKELFWDDEETVMQLHPPKSRWINNHPYCLHLWRPTTDVIPLPPDVTVGFQELNVDSPG